MSFVRRVNSLLPFQVAIAGRKRNALFSVLDPLFSKSTHDDVIATEFGQIQLDSAHAPERWLSYAFYNILNYYKNSELGQYIAQNAHAGTTFIDVGANLGLYALVARCYGYATLLVEPEPSHAAFLSRNVAVFGRTVAVALSDHFGTMPLYYEDGNSGATSLVSAKGYQQGTDGIPVRTFSSLVSEGLIVNPRDVDLIKIDVEGAEAQTVAGMSDFFGLGCRPAIWCEVRGDRSGRAPGSCRAVAQTLEEFGYAAYEFIGGERREANASKLSDRGVFDMLFEAR